MGRRAVIIPILDYSKPIWQRPICDVQWTSVARYWDQSWLARSGAQGPVHWTGGSGKATLVGREAGAGPLQVKPLADTERLCGQCTDKPMLLPASVYFQDDPGDTPGTPHNPRPCIEAKARAPDSGCNSPKGPPPSFSRRLPHESLVSCSRPNRTGVPAIASATAAIGIPPLPLCAPVQS